VPAAPRAAGLSLVAGSAWRATASYALLAGFGVRVINARGARGCIAVGVLALLCLAESTGTLISINHQLRHIGASHAILHRAAYRGMDNDTMEYWLLEHGATLLSVAGSDGLLALPPP